MKLHYRKLGQGKPVLILHGLFGSSDNWNGIGKKLAEYGSTLPAGRQGSLTTGFEVYLIDQRNHGRSPHSDGFNYQLMSDDLCEFVDDNFIEDAVVIGHSLGGKTAMTFALQHPEKVKKLIVVDISPHASQAYLYLILQGLMSIDLGVVKSRKAADEQLSLTIGDLTLRKFLLKNLYWKEQGVLNWRFNLEIINREIKAVGEGIGDEKKFDKPTLFIRGGKSDYIPNSDFAMIKNIFPEAEIKTISNAGHWVHAEAPADFLDCVIKFLN